jgi:hypothetical protein
MRLHEIVEPEEGFVETAEPIACIADILKESSKENAFSPDDAFFDAATLIENRNKK